MQENKISRSAEEIVAGVISGEPKAESQLMGVCEPIVRACLKGLCSCPHDIDDLSQDSLLLILSHVRNGRLKEPKKLFAYTRSIARNKFIMQCRQNGRWTDTAAREWLRPDSMKKGDIEERISLKQEITLVWKQMNVLRDRSILTDTIVNDFSKQEMTRKYQMKAPHVDRVVFRARQRFRILWDENIGAVAG